MPGSSRLSAALDASTIRIDANLRVGASERRRPSDTRPRVIDDRWSHVQGARVGATRRRRRATGSPSPSHRRPSGGRTAAPSAAGPDAAAHGSAGLGRRSSLRHRQPRASIGRSPDRGTETPGASGDVDARAARSFQATVVVARGGARGWPRCARLANPPLHGGWHRGLAAWSAAAVGRRAEQSPGYRRDRLDSSPCPRVVAIAGHGSAAPAAQAGALASARAQGANREEARRGFSRRSGAS